MEELPAAPIPRPLPGAYAALSLLLSINLFNYVDRQVLAAVQPSIQEELHASHQMMGWAATAFLLSYMILSPVFGWLGDRTSRWIWIALGVGVWSVASGATGLIHGYAALIITRCFVGVGEAAYGPVAPTVLSDLFPVRERGRVLSWFNLAIPVGSALGYILGGGISRYLGWRWAFYLVVPPGLALGVYSLFMKEPPRGMVDTGHSTAAPRGSRRNEYLSLARNRSYVLATLGMAAMTFAMGGLGYWMPSYLIGLKTVGNEATVNLIFGAVLVVGGFTGTLSGGWIADRLRNRVRGSYFLVSAAGMIVGFPMFILMLYTPFPAAWVFVFLGIFFLFFNTGPSNAILANVTRSGIRATAFAINIFVIHILGDAISPVMIGWIADRWSLKAGFLAVSGMMLLGGVIWAGGAKFLENDTARALQP